MSKQALSTVLLAIVAGTLDIHFTEEGVEVYRKDADGNPEEKPADVDTLTEAERALVSESVAIGTAVVSGMVDSDSDLDQEYNDFLDQAKANYKELSINVEPQITREQFGNIVGAYLEHDHNENPIAHLLDSLFASSNFAEGKEYIDDDDDDERIF